MSLEELKDFAANTLGLDVEGVEDRSVLLQQILSQDESSYGAGS